jgi:adenylylsulfate kinase
MINPELPLYLVVSGYGDDATPITERMGIEPTEIWVRGAPFSELFPDARRRQSQWMLGSGLGFDASFTDHGERLLALLEPRRDALRALAVHYTVAIAVGRYYHTGDALFFFAESLVERFRALGLEPGFDQLPERVTQDVRIPPELKSPPETAVPTQESSMSTNIVWHAHTITREMRAKQKGQRPVMIWFTGLSGAGKSTIANAVESWLHDNGYHSYLLDGDNIRHGLNKDLGFSDKDRVENIRRIGEVGKLFVDSGMISLSAFISPFRADRQMVRGLFDAGDFIEVFVSTPIDVCETRDPKGLYKKARAGVIKQFTGIDSPYEPPANPEILVDTSKNNVEESALQVVDYLNAVGALAH